MEVIIVCMYLLLSFLFVIHTVLLKRVNMLTDILGPPGSGVEWLRYVIEQLTGLKTGSKHVVHPEIFTAEGHTTKVCEFVRCGSS